MTMRLIDAEALKTRIQKIESEVFEHGFNPPAKLANSLLFLEFLDNAPTIEAKPVVHAHWKPFIEDVEIYNTCGYREKRQTGWICSKCGKGFTEFGHTKYCSDCGAQMDEEKNN